MSNSGQSLPANTCLFHPTAGESHPSRLRASISSLVTARAPRPDNLTFSTPRPTYLSVFTCPTQRAWTSRRTPARASRPDNLTFSNLLLNEAHPSDTAISKPVGRRQEPPRQQPHLFLLDEAYPSDTAISKPVGRRHEPTGQSNLSFPFCSRQKPTQPRCCPLGEPRYPDGRRREHSRPDNLLFSNLRSSTLTIRHGDPETSRTRASQLDNLTFSSPMLGEAYPSDTAINETTVRRQQEPPSQTILPSMSHARRGLPVRLGDYQSQRRREPPSQTTHLFRQLAPPFEPRRTLHTRPSNNLSFQSTTGEVQSHVGSHKSLPAGQPHLFLLRQRS